MIRPMAERRGRGVSGRRAPQKASPPRTPRGDPPRGQRTPARGGSAVPQRGGRDRARRPDPAEESNTEALPSRRGRSSEPRAAIARRVESGRRPAAKGEEPRPRQERPRGPEYLPRAGAPPPRDPLQADVRRVVTELRELCGACAYRRICAFAPVKLQIERRAKHGAEHRHQPVLRRGLQRLEKLGGEWEAALVRQLAGREKDALLAACLLAERWRKHPKGARRLIEYTAERCDVDRLKAELAETPSRETVGLQPGQGIDPAALQERAFRGQVLRLGAFFADPDVLGALQEILVLGPDDDGRLDQNEAVAVLALLIGRKMPAERWIKGLEKDAKGPFRATFASRDPGNGGLDLFFPYRRGKRRSYLYYRREADGSERVSSVDKVRIDSLLHRLFVVFHSDEMKTHRVFKELCRHVNVRAGRYNVDHVLAGFNRLDRDDLLLLGIYAPALARAVGHFLGIAGYHRLIKFLYALRSESGRRGEEKVTAHEKVIQNEPTWNGLVAELGPDLIKSVFTVLFRLNASYKRRPYTTPTYLKIGEVAYLLTALAGWNPKGLELELKQGKKPLAFVAYGLQPPGKWSRVRVGKLHRAHDRALDGSDEALTRAVEQGMRYMALRHGKEDFAALERAAADEDWEPPARPVTPPREKIEASGEDFSEYEDSRDSDLAEFEEAADLFVVVEDHQTDEQGRLRTQRMPRQAAEEDDLDDSGSGDEDDDSDSRDAPPPRRRRR